MGAMSLLFLVLGIAVIGGAVMLATGRYSAPLPEAAPDQAIDGLPDIPVGELTPAEVEQVRLDQAPRGYRMADVDELIDRLSAEIAARDDVIAMRDAEIADLRGGPGDRA